ncbi:MAG TPA: dienelactone hydrolase family protein [Usitatibacter sp.]|jgi:carboxymethylenebutenolidase|nr:dienelactone hydrolase family protein [Usitatibacter sp.]
MSHAATGFAAAVQPVAAQTQVETDTQGLAAGDVKIAANDREIPGYYAMPANGRDLPVILVVQEIFGVHEHIRDVARRFAKEGYLAVAPELYARQGDVSKLGSIDAIRAIVAQVPDAQVMSDLDAAARWAAQQGGDLDRLGITGFCWGGRVTWLYAAHNPRLKAAVAWYGRVEGAGTDLQPRNPMDVVKDIHAPVLGLYGGADAGIPAEGVERMRTALRGAGKQAEIHIYPDAPHAFFADYRPSHREGPAQDGWRRALAWFRGHGVA